MGNETGAAVYQAKTADCDYVKRLSVKRKTAPLERRPRKNMLLKFYRK